MQELLEAIRVAVEESATADQKAAGAQSCRTILTALGSEPGTAMVLPGAPRPGAAAGLDATQLLDLVIARLRAALPAEGDTEVGPVPRRGVQIDMVRMPPPGVPRKR